MTAGLVAVLAKPALRGIFLPQPLFLRYLGRAFERRAFQGYIGHPIEFGGPVVFLELELVDVELSISSFRTTRRQ